MKNVRFLKNTGLYTPDTICIGSRCKNGPVSSKNDTHTLYYQIEKDLVILLYHCGTVETFSFNCELMTVAFQIKKLSDLKFNICFNTYGDYLKIFKLKIKHRGITDFILRYSHLTDDDFGNYKISFKNVEDAALFQLIFSEFLE